MPAHIYIRTGQYERSARSNATAARVDEQYFKKAGQQGMYPAMYYGHNLQFESAAAMFAGRHAQARNAAKQTVALLDPIGDASPMLEPYALQEAWVALRFGRWDDALQLKAPPATRVVQTALPTTSVAPPLPNRASSPRPNGSGSPSRRPRPRCLRT